MRVRDVPVQLFEKVTWQRLDSAAAQYVRWGVERKGGLGEIVGGKLAAAEAAKAGILRVLGERILRPDRQTDVATRIGRSILRCNVYTAQPSIPQRSWSFISQPLNVL